MTEPEPPHLQAVRSGTVVSHWASIQPDRPAIVAGDRTLTFAELDARANQLVRALRARGLGVDSGVALLCANRPEFAEVVAAVQRSGMRLTTVNWHLTADEVAYIVNDCGAAAFIADARFAAVAAEAGAAAPGAAVRLAVGGAIDGFDDYEAVVSAEAGDPLDETAIGTTMLYTSGTTGRPKGVHRPREVAGDLAVTAAVNNAARAYTPGAPGIHLCTGPLYHAAPLVASLVASLTMGYGCVLMDGWDAEETLRLIEQHRVTHSHMVPTMFHRLLSLPSEVRDRYDVSSLEFVVHGAAPCPVPVKQKLIDWLGPVVFEYYAATEGAGTVVTSEEWLRKPGTVGKTPTPDHVRILGEAGEDLPAGETGTVYLKAPGRARFDYYGDADKTAGAYRGDWFTLGDVGYLDEDGYLFLTDRSANLIISGGVNIYPAEVEAVLIDHPAVGDVAVIGIPNEEWGEEVKAVVEPQPGVEPTAELGVELIAFCRERVAAYKCPRSVDFVDELPRHDNGKLYKRLLRDQYRRVQ